MDSRKMTLERISALADSELAASDLSIAFAELSKVEGQSTWDIYHQIGDVLRTDEMALSLSPTFASSFSARLASEPTVIGSLPAPMVVEENSGKNSKFAFFSIRKMAVSGVAVAATAATFALVNTSQLMVASKSESTHDVASTMMVSTSKVVLPADAVRAVIQPNEQVMLRDPQIDQYLLAHQRFSPSAYSIAQYARSATFATNSNK